METQNAFHNFRTHQEICFPFCNVSYRVMDRLRDVMSRAMFREKTHSILQVNRTAKIYIVQTALMTLQTTTAGLLRREL
jgi:hypothetical protein